MCVAVTAKRRRRQMKNSRAYRKKDPVTAAKRLARLVESERARQKKK